MIYLCACTMCFYDTNGSGVDVRFAEEPLKQVNLRLAVRMCYRVAVTALVGHYVPDDSVYTVILCDCIR